MSHMRRESPSFCTARLATLQEYMECVAPYIFEPVLAHGTEKRDSALKVVLVILQGLGHAFPHSLVARKMDDCIKPVCNQSHALPSDTFPNRALTARKADDCIKHGCRQSGALPSIKALYPHDIAT
eukprot:713475-Pelagomonas_calceolata.AAC.7